MTGPLYFGGKQLVQNQIFLLVQSSLIAGAEHRSKDGVGHFLMLEDPKFWTESIVEFLTKAGLPGQLTFPKTKLEQIWGEVKSQI